MLRRITFSLALLLITAGIVLACGSHDRALAQGAPASENPILLPPSTGGKRITVEIAMHIINLSDINEVDGTFRVTFYLFAEWKDPRLAFVPDHQWQKFKIFPDGSIWRPRFEFLNGVDGHTVYETSQRVAPDGSVSFTEAGSATLTATFHLREFPFDSQNLLILVHPFTSQSHVIRFHDDDPQTSLTAEDKVYSSLAQWNLLGISAHTRMVELPRSRGQIAEARFGIHIKRRFMFYIWKVFVPLLLMVILSWTVFWVDPADLCSQVEISVTTILTVIAFAFAISLSLPKVPYLTLIDAFFLTCYVFVFLTAVELTTVHVAGRSRYSHVGLRIRHLTRIALPIAFAAANAVIFVRFLG